MKNEIVSWEIINQNKIAILYLQQLKCIIDEISYGIQMRAGI